MDTKNQAQSPSPEIIDGDDGPVSPDQLGATFQADKSFKSKGQAHPEELGAGRDEAPRPLSLVAAFCKEEDSHLKDDKKETSTNNVEICNTENISGASQASAATHESESIPAPTSLRIEQPASTTSSADEESTSPHSRSTDSAVLQHSTLFDCTGMTSTSVPTLSLNDTTLDGVVLSTFYRVEAKLVTDSTALQINDDDQSPPAPVYDAVLVPVQSPKTWWKKNQGILLVGFLVIGALVAALAVVLPQKPDPPVPDPEPEPIKVHPRHSNSCAALRNTLFETDCDDCQPNIGINGNTVVVAKNNDYVQFLSSTKGSLEEDSTIDINYSAWMVLVTDNVTAVGGGNDTSGAGAVHLFDKNSAGEWYESEVLLPQDINNNTRFGSSVSIGGGRMAVGAVNDSVSVFYNVNDSWKLETTIPPPDISNLNNFGRTVEIKDSTIMVGDRVYGNPRKGAVFVYAYDASSKSWRLRATVTNDDCDNWFGTSLSILDDGMVIGCPRNNGGIGAAYFYQGNHSTCQYKLSQKILSSKGMFYDNFAHNSQLSIDGDVMAVGTNRKWNGTAYLFTMMEDEWLEFAKIEEPESAPTEHFGDVIDLFGDNLVIASANNAYMYSVGKCLSLL